MNYKLVKQLLALLLVLPLSHCGGGSSSTGAFTSGLSRTSPISSITVEEYQQLCESTQRWIRRRSTVAGFCTLSGMTLALDAPASGQVQSCEEARTICIEDRAPAEYLDSCIVTPPEAQALAQCPRSIEELDDCLNSYLELLEDIFDALSCDLLSNRALLEEALSPFTTIPESEVCRSLKAACPNLFQDGEL